MSPTLQGEASRSGTPPASAGGRADLSRWLGPAVIAVAILPIWVAVFKNGLRGFFPYSDAANTILRARDVFDGPFPLVGMKAAGGSQAGYEVYFPGAWQLYAIALPTRVFGVVWGPLLAMGLVNSAWVALTGWFLLRRLRRTEALVGIALMALLLWSIGSGFLISPVPMQMVIIPMALLLVSAWAVADGDPVALPVLALVANYLFLGHLVLVVTVPVVVGTALVGLAAWFLGRRRAGMDSPEQRRRTVKGIVAAAAVTVGMWVPPVIQQLTTSPGNLRLLFGSAGSERPMVASWEWAIHFVVSLIGRPPFWFRGTLRDPPSQAPSIGGDLIGSLPAYDVLILVIVVGLGVALGIAARRRGDRTGLWLLIVAALAVVAATVTAYSAPTYLGRPNGYLRAVWATAMFVWLALGVNALRWLRGRVPSRVIVAPALAVILVFTVLNFPTAGYGYDSDVRADRIVVDMNDAVVPRLEGRGPFRIAEGGFSGHTYGASLRLALAQAGVEVCFNRTRARTDGSRKICPDDVDTTLAVRVLPGLDSTVDGEVLYRRVLLDREDQERLEPLDAQVQDWLESVGRLRLTPDALDALDSFEQDAMDLLEEDIEVPDLVTPIREILAKDPREVAELGNDSTFIQFVRLWYGSPLGWDSDLFEDSVLTSETWREWAEIAVGADVLFVYEISSEDPGALDGPGDPGRVGDRDNGPVGGR